MLGEIKFVHPKGFGFIMLTDDYGAVVGEFFFHRDRVIGDTLPYKNAEVSFLVDDNPGPRGGLIAVQIEVRRPVYNSGLD